MRTHSKYFRFSKLANVSGASTVVRVAMVCNDLAVANSSMSRYRKMDSGAVSHVRQGALLYLVRMSCGHLSEGIKAIHAVQAHRYLSALVRKCHPRAQAAFADLRECLPRGRDHTDFRRYILSIRDKTAFHYDNKQINRAMVDRVRRSTSSGVCSITLGEDIHSTRFEFADSLLDTIVCRELWRLPDDADASVEANRISDWCCQKSIQFLDFGDDFVRRYMLQHAV